MSEPIPESIPTSHDRHSRRPVKRQAVTALAKHASQVDALFANPEREVHIPDPSRDKGGVGAPPEIVNNVQGSSAGAGSGEFHVYKASRRREYERLRAMDEEVQKEKDAEEFEREREEKREREDKRMGKNKARRDKAKMRKQKGGGELTGTERGVKGAEGGGGKGGGGKGEGKEVQGEGGSGEQVPGEEKESVVSKEEEVQGLVIHDED